MSKYDLVICERIVKTISTGIFNRESVLMDMINKADGMPFRVLLTTDKEIKLVLDSKKDKSFIKYLVYGKIPNS